MSEELTINIKFSNETKLSVTLNTTDTVSVLKQKIAEQLKSTDTPLEPDQQILIYAGRILKNDAETIESIKIKNGNTIHMVKAKPKQKPAETTEKAAETTAASNTSSTPAQTSTTPVSAQPAAPQPSPMSGSDANAAAANPFAQLGQAGGNPFAQLGFNSGFAAGMNNQSPFGGNLPPLDPNMLNEMLNNPPVLNMLSSMFQNPQMMDMLFSSSPQLAAFNTPEFRSTMNQMMSNPETLRSILQLSNMYGNMFGPNGPSAGAAGAAANPFANFQAPATTPAANTASTPAGTTPSSNTTAPQMPDMSALLSMLGGMPGMGMGAPGATGTAGAAANNAANQQPPEVRYSTQLAQLQDMGFYDSAQNIRALTISGGRVEAAVEWLLNNPF